VRVQSEKKSERGEAERAADGYYYSLPSVLLQLDARYFRQGNFIATSFLQHETLVRKRLAHVYITSVTSP